ncbi:hypothetical protein L484_019407 [Morus notabilis]|uniref:Uncharacterized protein n=1 Tax=Morus notabilis TaxID=981085 RepID=W9RZ06_9ROSA|nr:hypothetical protein L484_019407 [Morus notabilis]
MGGGGGLVLNQREAWRDLDDEYSALRLPGEVFFSDVDSQLSSSSPKLIRDGGERRSATELRPRCCKQHCDGGCMKYSLMKPTGMADRNRKPSVVGDLCASDRNTIGTFVVATHAPPTTLEDAAASAEIRARIWPEAESGHDCQAATMRDWRLFGRLRKHKKKIKDLAGGGLRPASISVLWSRPSGHAESGQLRPSGCGIWMWRLFGRMKLLVAVSNPLGFAAQRCGPDKEHIPN